MDRDKHDKGRKLPAEPLTRDQVVALMNACSKRAPSGKRGFGKPFWHSILRGTGHVTSHIESTAGPLSRPA